MATYNYQEILEKWQNENPVNVDTENTNKFDRSGFKLPKSETENQSLPMEFDAKDIGESALAGAADSVTFLLDIPSMIAKGTDFVQQKVIRPSALKAVMYMMQVTGADENEMKIMETNIKKSLDFAKKQEKISNDKLAVGTTINEAAEKNNVYPFNYESKTAGGKIIKTAVEYALPSAIFAPAGYTKFMTASGAVSGAIDGAITNAGNDMAGTITGVGLNITADILKLRKGNAKSISKRITDSFSKEELEIAANLQKVAKADGIDLKVSDVLEGSVINKYEVDVMGTEIGMNIVEKFWKTRPPQLKKYIKKWAKENGLISNQKVLSESEQFQNIKNVAIGLQTNRNWLWGKAGGNDILKFYYPSQSVDNLVIEAKNIIKNSDNATLNSAMNTYITMLKKSDGLGKNLHGIYRDIRDIGNDLSSNLEKSFSDKQQIKAFKTMENMLSETMSTNPGFKKAQDTYKIFTSEKIEKGFDKLKFFKDVRKAKDEIYSNQELTAKMYKFFGSDKVSTKDIKLMAESFAESAKVTKGMDAKTIAKIEKNQDAWRELISGYFESNFLQAHSKGLEKGLKDGDIMYRAMMNSKVKRQNFTEMLFQLAKQEDKSIQRIDIQKAFDSFATILKSTGAKRSQGSNTFNKFLGADELGDNKISQALGTKGGIPFTEMISKFFSNNMKSKTSKIIADALTSPDGINDLIKLSKGWRDPDNAKMFAVNLLKLGTSDEILEENTQ